MASVSGLNPTTKPANNADLSNLAADKKAQESKTTDEAVKKPERKELELQHIPPSTLDSKLALQVTEKTKSESASGRLMGAVSQSLKWLSHKGMIVGGGLAFVGYMLLGKLLAIPGLLIAIPSAIIYFTQPAASSKPENDKQGKANSDQSLLGKLSDLIKEPHKLEVKETAEFFEELSRNANKFTAEVKDQILEKLYELSTRFIKPHEHKDKASQEAANIVKSSLERGIAEFSPKVS